MKITYISKLTLLVINSQKISQYSRYSTTYEPLRSRVDCPPGVYPTTVTVYETHITATGSAQSTTPPDPETLDYIHPMFHCLDVTFQKYFEMMNHQNITDKLGKDIAHNKVIASVDGSYDPLKELGTAC